MKQTIKRSRGIKYLEEQLAMVTEEMHRCNKLLMSESASKEQLERYQKDAFHYDEMRIQLLLKIAELEAQRDSSFSSAFTVAVILAFLYSLVEYATKIYTADLYLLQPELIGVAGFGLATYYLFKRVQQD